MKYHMAKKYKTYRARTPHAERTTKPTPQCPHANVKRKTMTSCFFAIEQVPAVK
jgi:hypothetical protein